MAVILVRSQQCVSESEFKENYNCDYEETKGYHGIRKSKTNISGERRQITLGEKI